MAYTTINKSSLHFNTKLYTGNGGTNAITGVGFQPDKVWIKERNGTNNHEIHDVVRGVNYQIYTNLNNAQTNAANHLTTFGTDGFTVGSDGAVNTNSNTYCSWNWKASNSQGSSNTDGSINTTYTSVNTTAGFSISQFEGTGSVATVGHGLGVQPSLIIVKNIDAAQNWLMYHKELGATKYLRLNLNNAEGSSSAVWNNTEPTTSVFTVGTDGAVNANGQTHVAYCFAEKTGYSKFGSYTANNNADGPFIYLGFKPALAILKITATSGNFHMFDNKRTTSNTSTSPWRLRAEADFAEAQDTNDKIDFVSNGIKIKSNSVSINNHTGNVVYWAFAEAPIVGSNNIPATAR